MDEKGGENINDNSHVDRAASCLSGLIQILLVLHLIGLIRNKRQEAGLLNGRADTVLGH